MVHNRASATIRRCCPCQKGFSDLYKKPKTMPCPVGTSAVKGSPARSQMHLPRQSIISPTIPLLMTLRSLLGLSMTVAYKPPTSKPDLFVHYLAGVELPMVLPELLSHSHTPHCPSIASNLVAGGGFGDVGSGRRWPECHSLRFFFLLAPRR
jgi:hypothetical protein